MYQNKFKLKVILWVNGVLKTITKFFASLIEAIEESKMWHGIVKVYNYLEQLIHSSVHDCDGYATNG